MNHSNYLLKQAWAGLSAKKGFLVTIVTTLGLSLGALLCILTLAYVVISKPLPYPEQERLYRVNSIYSDENSGVIGSFYDYPILTRLFETQTVFSESALVYHGSGVLTSQPTQPTVRNTFVTSDWFSMLGSNMVMGRAFQETEDLGSFNPVAVLSYEFWQSEFNSDASVLEQTVSLGGTNFRVVGVLAESFIEPQLIGIGVKSDIYLPWDFNAHPTQRREDFESFLVDLYLVGKLDSQQSIAQIEQDLSISFNTYWNENINWGGWLLSMELEPFKKAILGDSQNTVLLLLAGVVGLILIACTNITNLFMSRTADQQRELAIQAAVGASRRQLFQTLFAQSGLVVFLSSIVALIVAIAGFWVLRQYLAQRLPRVDELAVNSVTLGAALVIALLLGVFFARVSAGMINYRALNMTLQSSGKGTGVQVSKGVRQWLIISQVTIVTLLVFVNIGLLRDSLKVINQPLGFETDNITTLTLRIDSAENLSDEERKSFLLELKNKLKALPQVEDVSQSVLPLNPTRQIDHSVEGSQDRPLTLTRFVDDRYFQLINQPLIEGDYFSEADFNDHNSLIIINETYADQIVADGLVQGSVMGTKIEMVGIDYIVSGVVKGVKMPTENEIPKRAYIPLQGPSVHYMMKLKPNQSLSREMMVNIAQEISSQFFVLKLETLNEKRGKLLFTQYTTAITSAVLAVLTFFLATTGLYGILSYATLMRRFELGTRLAIGAKRNDIIGLIIKDNAGSVAIGFVVSLVIMTGLYLGFSEALISYANAQLIPLFAGTLVLISVMTLFACYWPLRTIINSRPIHSLRGSQ